MENNIPSLVIDTNVLIHYCTIDSKYFEISMSLVIAIKENRLNIVVDHYGEILDEYVKNIKRKCISNHSKGFMNHWIYRVQSKFCYVEPIDERKIKPLEKMGFHPKDLKFLRVAPCSNLKKIISTDTRSFLADEFKEWIEKELEVEVQDPIKFYEEFLQTL